jgi:hypothetical protein
MDINKFIELRPHLYHLTDERNINPILQSRTLNSAAVLAKLGGVPNLSEFLRTRRRGHFPIENGSFLAILRDQDPLFEKIVTKNLEGGWTFGDFVYSLNSRVFFWPTEKDLKTHYKRYENQNEYPKIIRVATEDLFAINKTEAQFCRLNSGAPRCSSHYKEGAPPRGPKTFLVASEYPDSPSSIREVTFIKSCILPDNIWISNHPDQEFQKYL